MIVPSWIVIHSEQGKDRPDGFDFGGVDEQMSKRGVHYDYFCELVEDKPVLIRQWPVHQVGAHCRGWNGTTGSRGRAIGFAFAGDARVSPPTDEQLDLVARFVVEQMLAYNIPLTQVRMHRDMPGANTDCPGAAFPVARFLSLVKARMV